MSTSTSAQLVTWKDLSPRTKCIYQAFTKAVSVQGSVLAAFVNSKGVSADDGEAVIILAKEYGFKCEGAFAGEFFLNSVNYRPEANSHLIIVITTSGDTQGAPAIRSLFQSSSQVGGTDPTKPLTDPRFANVQWHAIYAKTDASNKVVLWKDDQGQRSNGPLTGDYCVVFSRSIT